MWKETPSFTWNNKTRTSSSIPSSIVWVLCCPKSCISNQSSPYINLKNELAIIYTFQQSTQLQQAQILRLSLFSLANAVYHTLTSTTFRAVFFLVIVSPKVFIFVTVLKSINITAQDKTCWIYWKYFMFSDPHFENSPTNFHYNSNLPLIPITIQIIHISHL